MPFAEVRQVNKLQLAQRYLGTLPARAPDEGAAWHPHVLAVSVVGPFAEKAKVPITDIAKACLVEFRESFETIQFIWGDFFDGWALDLMASNVAAGLIAQGNAKPILDGRHHASIVFPVPLFPATPLDRGRPQRSGHDVEGPAREAALTQLLQRPWPLPRMFTARVTLTPKG